MSSLARRENSTRLFASFLTLDNLLQDLRYAARIIRRNPSYALLTMAIMALGIAATTTLASVTYGVLLKPLPWADAHRIARVEETRGGRPGRIRGTLTNGSYLAWGEQPTTIDAIAGYSVTSNTMTMHSAGAETPIRGMVGRVTPSLFTVIGAVPLRGRVFVSDDAQIGGGAYPDPRVAILSYGLWQEWFGGRNEVIGGAVRIDGVAVTIVGVMPPEFAFPDQQTRAWLPMPVGSVIGDRDVRRLMIFGALARLKPGYSFAQAAAEATARARTAPDPGFAAVSLFGSTAPPDITLTPVLEAMTAEVRPAITILFLAAVLLLATATANVGSLQVVRATSRRREMAVRAAIGAGRARLTGQLVIESAYLGLGAAVAGLLLTLALHRVMPALVPADFPRLGEVAINPGVLLFAIVVSVAASIVCGILPARDARRLNLVDALTEGATSTSGGWRSRAGRLRLLTMAGQVAVACVLLVGAALLARSFVALLKADRGYDPVQLLTARVDLGATYDGLRRAEFADAIAARMRAVPGVTQVAAGNALPYLNAGGTVGFALRSPAAPEISQQVQAITRVVSPTYFDALKLRVLDGRALSDADTASSRPVIVVNRSFAQRYLGASPIGTRLPMSFGESRPDGDVVGVVDDMRQGNVTDPPAPEIFVSYRQLPARLLFGPLILVVRTVGDPMEHLGTLRTAIAEQDPSAALDSVMTMEDRVLTSLARPRLYAALFGGFGLCALLIASAGLYAVLSYSVAQRTREIGVRTAIGAQPRDITRLVYTEAAAITVTGLVVGLTAAWLLSRTLGAFIYGVTTSDTVSFVAAAVVLSILAGIAAAVPARRAARLDPLTALKST